jgi:hypothetical protein
MSYISASSSLRRPSDEASVAVTPYFNYNEDLDLLSVATGPAFSERAQDGRINIYPAHLNRIKQAIRETTSQMSSGAWNGVRAGEARSLGKLSDSMNETYSFGRDAERPPIEREGTFQLSVYLTTENQPRQVPRGDHGLYEVTVPVSEAAMSNLPTAQIHVRSHHNGKSHYFHGIDVTMDGTVRDKATGRIVALQPSAVQEIAHGFAHMVPFIQDRLRGLTHLDNREHLSFFEALLKARKDVRSLAESTVHRLVHFDIDSNDVESVRPRGLDPIWTAKPELTPKMDGLGRIAVTFLADYSRMGGGESSSSTARGEERGRRG